MLFSKLLGSEGSKMQVKEATEEYPNGSMTGYAAVFNNVDLGGDVMVPGSFQKTVAENLPKGNIKLYDSHRIYAGTEAILGVVKRAEEDAYGLNVTAAFSSVQSAQDVRMKIKEGILSSMSFGFDIIRDSVETLNTNGLAERVRKILEVRLYEVSVVAWGMNPKAYIAGAKSRVPLSDFSFAPIEHVWDPKGAAARFKSWVSQQEQETWTEQQWSLYAKGFLFQEGGGEESAFKLSVVDIVDDKPVYVIGAVVAARDSLKSADLFGADTSALLSSCKRLLSRGGVAGDHAPVSPGVSSESVDNLIAEMKSALLVADMVKAAQAFRG